MIFKKKKKADLNSINFIKKDSPQSKIIALAGNPNVGKSTVFNRLTGLKQHTGNWPGKTVTNAAGECVFKGIKYTLVDLPGTYSLMANSVEEEIARDFICFGDSDAVIIVCDATCLERNLNLVLQTVEITDNVVVCVNLMDEAEKKHIQIDLNKLEKKLGVPVVSTSATKGKGVHALMDKVAEVLKNKIKPKAVDIAYPSTIEKALSIIKPALLDFPSSKIKHRWTALKLLNCDSDLSGKLSDYFGYQTIYSDSLNEKIQHAKKHLADNGITEENLNDIIVSSIVKTAESISSQTVFFGRNDYNSRDRKIDRILTSKRTGILIMISLLFVVFWLTISGANYPSKVLADGFFWFQNVLTDFFLWLGTPAWVHGILVLGIYRVLTWVISVMLPPMAIFFPLFTLLEDLGYLPRVAFNLDKQFKKCSACGKQALTMCMGFGCNAAGVIGCRIINSPRERLIAIITNNFVPCNGRFPTIIAIITMFFVGFATGLMESLLSTLILTAVIILGIFMTFFMSKMLSKTFLKGVPSSFTLELPPYRKPQIGKVIVRSIFDRTLFVLGRAIVIAAPAGLIIWIMANYHIGNISLLAHCSGFLDPFARLIGLDGVILLAFILGFPANEIVVPIIIMAYMTTGHIVEFDSLSQLKTLLIDNGWTWLTAVCTILFSLFHWPCSTTCLTIQKETQSFKWTALSFIIPTIIGVVICFSIANLARLIGLA